MGDDELTDRLATDLGGSIELLVCAYERRLYAFGLTLTRSPRDAEEVAQDTFVRAYRALATYSPERIAALHLRPWLFQIAVNVARNRLRRVQIPEVPLDGVSRTDGPVARLTAERSDEPEAQAMAREGDARVGRLVGELPTRYREAVVLRHVHGLGYGEIAAIVGQPVGTVKSNVHRGVALLRAELAAERSVVPASAPVAR